MAKADELGAGAKDIDEPWSEELAREAWLEALSCFDAVNAALAGSTSRNALVVAAIREFCEREEAAARAGAPPPAPPASGS